VSGALLLAPGAVSAESPSGAGFSVLASDWSHEGLPQALRDLAGSPDAVWSDAEYLAAGPAVSIRWLARESVAVDAYRVTAVIQGGPSAGVTAQWIVRRRSPASGGLFGYELRLPPVAGPSSPVVATLEALGRGGEKLATLSASGILSPGAGPWLRGRPVVRSGASGSRSAATTTRPPSLGPPPTFVAGEWPESTGTAFPVGAGSLAGLAASVPARGPPA
jgi:hypothetical protein